MRISTVEISSYIKCPIFYLEGHRVEPQERKIVDSLRRAVQYLYSHHMANNEICNFNALIKRWNQIWWGKQRPEDEDSMKLSNEAYVVIDKYYNIYLDREYEGAYTNWPYAVEIGPHIITGVWPVVLTNSDNSTELYYPLVQKGPMRVIRDIMVKADVVAMDAAIGQAPQKVTFSQYFPERDERVLMGEFFPRPDWLERSYETLTTLITAIEKGFIWGNCHACRACPSRNRCTG
jgi:hypothetical protein